MVRRCGGEALDLVRRLKEPGNCVIYISHIMRDVFEIADPNFPTVSNLLTIGSKRGAKPPSNVPRFEAGNRLKCP